MNNGELIMNNGELIMNNGITDLYCMDERGFAEAIDENGDIIDSIAISELNETEIEQLIKNEIDSVAFFSELTTDCIDSVVSGDLEIDEWTGYVSISPDDFSELAQEYALLKLHAIQTGAYSKILDTVHPVTRRNVG
jgi:hypothetical protein